MKLLRLILQGFKSFADKTTIEFADGMTVIVGPNGCGKSNISDAVRWVLGEQNVHNLRGQKTEDIISPGQKEETEKCSGSHHGIDNSAHEFSFDTAEVSITRRVLRNGESDFYINKRSCRLKDIQELLADTGLGKGSMAIIGQNRVDQVLTSRPEDRRLIFEEVAGISLFRMRKNEGLRKLEKTAENMERVRDLVALLDEQLGPMKEAAEKSKIYKALSKDRRAVEATMSLLRLTSVGRMIARYENEYNSLADQDVKWQTELARYAEAKAKLEKEELEQQENLRKAGADSAEKQRLMETPAGLPCQEEALRHAEEESVRLKEDEKTKTEAENELKEEMREMLEELAEAESLLLEKQTLLKAEEEKRRIAESELWQRKRLIRMHWQSTAEGWRKRKAWNGK
ncbi:MAG: AAA family ATPase [Dialister invisus]